ncbi:hypothetical protein D9M71_443370 [compost metagenome]
MCLALGFAHRLAAQQGDGLFGGEHVGDVAEVQAAHQLLWRHVGQQFPHGLALVLGPQVPHRVDDGGGGQVDHALFRAQPAQLAVADGKAMPESAHVGADFFERKADDQGGQRLHRCRAYLVATANGECQAVAFEGCSVGVQHHVGRRIVGGTVHGVGAIQRQRSGETDIANAQVGNAYAHGRLLFCSGTGRADCRLSSDTGIIAKS